MKKKIVLLLSTLLFITLLAACATESNTEEENDVNGNTEVESEQPESLLVWAPNDQASTVEELTNGFTEETGIAVEVVPFAMDEQEESMSLDGPSGNGPDLFFQPGVGSLTLKGLVQPMEVDQEILNSYSEGSVEALSYEGEIYGLPAVIETLALYYNKDLVSDPPETIADLEAIAEELTDPSNDEFGFLYPATDLYFSYPFIAGFGGYMVGEENNIYNVDDIGLANSGAQKSGEMIQSWFENGYLPSSVNMDIVTGLFNDGKVGVIINGPWAINDHERALGDKLATAPLPMLDNGEYPVTFLGTKGWMLSNFTEYPEAATELAIYLTNEDSLQKYYEETGEMPAKSSILSSDEFQNDPLLTGFGTQLERAMPFPPTPELSAVWNAMADALTFISEGEDVEESLQGAVDEIKQDIEMNYK